MNKSSFISLNAIVNRVVSVLFGLDYIRISNDECQIDIVGYQVDRHFACFVTQNDDSNYINIFQLDNNNNKFGEIKYKQPNDYSINVTYYDDYISLDEVDNHFYPLEKIE